MKLQYILFLDGNVHFSAIYSNDGILNTSECRFLCVYRLESGLRENIMWNRTAAGRNRTLGPWKHITESNVCN